MKVRLKTNVLYADKKMNLEKGAIGKVEKSEWNSHKQSICVSFSGDFVSRIICRSDLESITKQERKALKLERIRSEVESELRERIAIEEARKVSDAMIEMNQKIIDLKENNKSLTKEISRLNEHISDLLSENESADLKEEIAVLKYEKAELVSDLDYWKVRCLINEVQFSSFRELSTKTIESLKKDIELYSTGVNSKWVKPIMPAPEVRE